MKTHAFKNKYFKVETNRDGEVFITQLSNKSAIRIGLLGNPGSFTISDASRDKVQATIMITPQYEVIVP